MKKSADKLKEIQTLLKVTYGIVPIVAGLDKYTNLLTSWTDYLPVWLVGSLPISSSAFMMIIGVVEIAAGIIVFYKPWGGYIISAWLSLIAVFLILGGKHFDVAVRDLVMAIGALVLVKITGLIEDKSIKNE